jgi:hypothetical protein
MGLKGILTSLGMNAIGVTMLLVSVVAFVGILVWAFTRPREELEADSRLWKDEED